MIRLGFSSWHGGFTQDVLFFGSSHQDDRFRLSHFLDPRNNVVVPDDGRTFGSYR
jgi:hypothetical protein